MEKMLIKIGYTNIALLAASTVILMSYVDLKNPSFLDYVMVAAYGITVLTHIIRLFLKK